MATIGTLVFAAILIPFFSPAASQSDSPLNKEKPKRFGYVPGEILIRFRAGAAAAKGLGADIHVDRDGREIPVRIEKLQGEEIVPGLRVGRVAPDQTLAAIEALNGRPDVIYAEPNYRRFKTASPSDPLYSDLWGLKNTGQAGGTAGIDINAEAAWDITTGSQSVVVAVIDEGIDINHQDLQANIWQNVGEIAGNGTDDDGNGFVDDKNGYDFFHNDAGVYDGPGTNPDGSRVDEHGTHVAGTVGAVGNNGIGVVGVSWQVSLMSLKFLGPEGGSSADAIRAYTYAKNMRDRWLNTGGTQGANVRVTNNSYGGGSFSQAEFDAIQAMGASGILFIAAAGNEAQDLNALPIYPASYDLPSLVSVASIDRNGNLSSSSNQGSRAVHLGAPGTAVLSTTPGNTYSSFTGTSMAAPHVSGTAALVLAAHADFTIGRLRASLLFGGTPTPSLDKTTITGARVSAFGSLQNAADNDTFAPGPINDFQVAGQAGRAVTLTWTSVGDDGMSGRASLGEVRFVDGSSGAGYVLDILLPENSGAAEFSNVRIPYGHTSGTLSLRILDNAGNETTASSPVTVTLDEAEPYLITQGTTASLSTGGTRLNSSFDDSISGYSLPFTFPFFDHSFSFVEVSTNGTIYVPPTPVPNNDAFSSSDWVAGFRMIAGLWDDLDLSTNKRADADIYVVTPDPDRLIFRWQGVPCNFDFALGNCAGGAPVNFEIELQRNGTIITRYGDGNTALHPVVGIGGGDRDPFVIASHTSTTSPKDLTNAPAVTYTRRATLKTPNVTLTTVSNPQLVRIGQNLQLVTTLGNSGTAPASAVVVTDTIPTSTTFISCTTTQGVCRAPTPGDSRIVIGVGVIPPGGTVTITVVVNATAEPNLFYLNHLSVSSLTESIKTASSISVVISPNPTPLVGAIGVAAGNNHTFAILSGGSLLGWGESFNGQVGNGTVGQFAPRPEYINLSAVIDVKGGVNHSLALRTDGSVWAWGANFFGEVGDGTTTTRPLPVKVNGLSGVTAIAAGGSHNLALKSDGTVWAWGNNSNGQLGDTSTTSRSTPVKVSGLTNVKALGASNLASFAIKQDGTLWAWGANQFGQLGDGTNLDRLAPVQVIGISNVNSVGGGEGHTVAVRTDGTVWAWGWNNFGQVGDASFNNRNTPVQVVGISSATAIAAGGSHSLALLSNGTIMGWGDNQNGQLGNGSDESLNASDKRHSTPIPVDWLTGVTAICAGRQHSIALQQGGMVWGWGNGNTGQLGDARLSSHSYVREASEPLPAPAPIGILGTPTFSPDGGSYVSTIQVRLDTPNSSSGIKSLWSGGDHVLVQSADDSFYGWGRNQMAEVGVPVTQPFPKPEEIYIKAPVSISGLGPGVKIAVGMFHNVILKADGTVWTFGGNSNGELGRATTFNSSETLGQVPGMTDVKAVAAGGQSSLALKNDGTVWFWGLTFEPRATQLNPVQVAGLSGITSIAVDGTHGLAVKNDGSVWCWGINFYGQLGDGTTVSRAAPAQVPGLSSIVAVAAGGESSFALRSDGTLWAWGANYGVQLGIGTFNQTNPTPTQVVGISGVTAVSASVQHTLALKSDGTVWSWGTNYNGRLGVPITTFQRLTPGVVDGLSNVKSIATGWGHSAALKHDGTLWVWGRNEYWQLGDGTNMSQYAPVMMDRFSAGFEIRYTVNGNEPTESDPSVAAGTSILVSANTVLKARAFKNGWTASGVRTAAYTFTGAANPVDDARAFVRQHYLDFLAREPDQGGSDYWTFQLTECGINDVLCVHQRRIGVSAAFFVELEFQRTGYVVYRMHRAAFGFWPNTTTRANITFQKFMEDRPLLPEGADLAQSTINFANAFVARPEFLQVYPASITNTEFVNLLFDSADLKPYTTERQQQIDAMTNGGKTRAQVLLDLIEINEFKTREYNRSFVLMQYFGYLRRDPDQGGYDFWVNILDNREPNNYRSMVCGFITSAEYQQRFGTAVTRTNSDCAQ